MKKATMNTILSLIATIDTPEAEEVRAELTAELNKGKEKADANRALYEQAHDVVIPALSETPVTIAELYEEVKERLPQDFSKGKLQHAITRMWTDEITKVEGKVNGYCLKS